MEVAFSRLLTFEERVELSLHNSIIQNRDERTNQENILMKLQKAIHSNISYA